MKYIHYDCLKNWLNSKIEEDISVDSENPEIEDISYNRKDISCELCKEKFPDYVKFNNRYYNISFYKPKFEEFIVLESMRADKHKAKFIHIISFDKKNSINLGRANECELSISELSVSRFHCIIHKDEGDLYLEDNSSKFGTLVLIQNNNMLMNDYVPLRVQINKTFIKLKVVIPFKFSCCKTPQISESKKYDYQIQNRKCFDILSYFIIKENNNQQVDDDQEDNEKDKNNIELIDDYNKNNAENKNNEIELESENKNLIDDKESKNENTKKEEKKSEFDDNEHFDVKSHSSLIRKVNIKKGQDDSKELPDLGKINIDHFKDSISQMEEKEINSPKNNLGNSQQNKTINLIRLNKREGSNINNVKTNQNGTRATHGNTGQVISSQANFDKK